jgi:hypothetical protein
MRDDPCDLLADTDADGRRISATATATTTGWATRRRARSIQAGAKGCRVLADCDDDGVIDIVEIAAGSSPTDPSSLPEDAGLYFVLPYQGGELTRDFTFATASRGRIFISSSTRRRRCSPPSTP